jgi:GDP-D-mannose 3',5'-epimerase
MKRALVLGAGGFIGSNMVKRLKRENYYVTGVDMKLPEFSPTLADDFLIGDLRNRNFVERAISVNGEYDELYQLAADMGGAGYIFSGKHDADIMHNSAIINLNIAERAAEVKMPKMFFSSSACAYPGRNQLDPDNPNCVEDSMYPAQPDSDYGWEKIYAERTYQAYQRNYGLDVRIARFHNVFGPEGCWNNGKEKAPAALSRKIAEAKDGDVIDVWGDGKQTRTFLYIDECIEGVMHLMSCVETFEPMNIGSEEMVSINQLAEMIIEISGKQLTITHIEGPCGVRGRCSDSTLIYKNLKWKPNYPLVEGLEKTYRWIYKQVHG